MTLAEILLPEFDAETRNTRRVLERVPEEHFDWSPHEKSYSLRDLTTHLSNVPSWTELTLKASEFDIAPVGEDPPRVDPVESVAEALERFDRNVIEARACVASATEEELQLPWTLLMGGKEIFTQTRLSVYRSMIMNHLVHHRAQLGVYLRLRDVPLPNIYGPTADER